MSPFKGVREYVSQYPPLTVPEQDLSSLRLRCGTCCGTSCPCPLSRPWGPLFAFCAKKEKTVVATNY